MLPSGILTCCTGPFWSDSLCLFGFSLPSLRCLLSALTQAGGGDLLFRFARSVQSCCGEGGALQADVAVCGEHSPCSGQAATASGPGSQRFARPAFSLRGPSLLTFTILFLQVHQSGVILHLCHLLFLSSLLYIFLCIHISLSFSLCKFISKCAIIFFAMVHRIVSLISLSVFSLFIYSNVRDFCVITYIPQYYSIHWLTPAIFSWCL